MLFLLSTKKAFVNRRLRGSFDSFDKWFRTDGKKFAGNSSRGTRRGIFARNQK